MDDEHDLLAAERDLYLSLLELGHQTELQASLEEALRLAVEVTGAEQGYLHLGAEGEAEPRWAIARSGDERDVATIRARISNGIVRHAMASGETVHTPSALLDPMLNDLLSVRERKIEAVLCIPLGGTPPAGVLYLQKRSGEGPFPDDHLQLAQTFVRHVTPILDRLLAEERGKKLGDPTRRWRARLKLDGIIGRSAALARALEQVSHFAATDMSMLITGPSGTGKTSIAEAIHRNSGRSAGPFVAVGASMFHHERARADLFGYVKGSHSAAERDTPGFVDAAAGGTLFIDDIDALPLDAQPHLLQFLQDRIYTPFGGTVTKRGDVRMLFATNANPNAEVLAGRLRKDLYFRMNEVTFRMPSLAERREDIPILAQRFLADACEQRRVATLPLSPMALALLETADWPGEVRELQSCVRAGVMRAAGEGATQVEVRHLFPSEVAAHEPEQMTFHEATRWFQRTLVETTLRKTGWDVAKTRELLALSRGYVYTLINTHGLEPDRE